MTIQEIIGWNAERLAAMSDEELKKALGDLIPAARKPDDKLLLKSHVDLLNQAKSILASMEK